VSGRELIVAIAAATGRAARGLAATGKLFLPRHHFQGACGPFVAAATPPISCGWRRNPRATRSHRRSFGAGLMAAQEGAMSKRLHCGRAAQQV
jgi:hypothetical protein